MDDIDFVMELYHNQYFAINSSLIFRSFFAQAAKKERKMSGNILIISRFWAGVIITLWLIYGYPMIMTATPLSFIVASVAGC